MLLDLLLIGQTIRFTGMGAVKEGGCPRHAHYTKGISGMKSSTLQLLEKLKYDVLTFIISTAFQ
jgi:hypothetical protein